MSGKYFKYIYVNKHVSVNGLKSNLEIAVEELSFICLVQVFCHSYVNPLLPAVVASESHTVRLNLGCWQDVASSISNMIVLKSCF